MFIIKSSSWFHDSANDNLFLFLKRKELWSTIWLFSSRNSSLFYFGVRQNSYEGSTFYTEIVFQASCLRNHIGEQKYLADSIFNIICIASSQ